MREIQQALEAELYNCALTLSLTLPDICAKVEYSEHKDWSKSKKYIEWFDAFAKKEFTYQGIELPSNNEISMAFIDGQVCWGIRCAVLHAGNYEVEGMAKKKYNYITFHVCKSKTAYFECEVVDGTSIELDAIKFCNNICRAALNYYEKTANKMLFSLNEVELIDW